MNIDRTANKKENNFENLSYIDSLRAVAIFLVVICHVSQAQREISNFIRIIFDFGKIGVQLFFFISAYTMCLSMNKHKEEHSIRNFYIRRFFRISPLYYVGITIYFVVSMIPFMQHGVVIADHEAYSTFNVLSNIFFVHGLIPSANNSIVPGGWSIGTEMLFYIFFPFIFMMYGRIGYKMNYVAPFLSLLLANAFLLVVWQFENGVLTNSFFYYNILNQLPVFIVGISYYHIEKTGSLNFSKAFNVMAFLILIFISFVLMYKMEFNVSLSVFVAGISFIFLLNFFKQIDYQFPLLQRLGQLSFSIYIFHFLFAFPLVIFITRILSASFPIGPYPLFLISILVTLTCSMLVAQLSEKLIEKPGIRLGKLVIGKLTGPSKKPH